MSVRKTIYNPLMRGRKLTLTLLLVVTFLLLLADLFLGPSSLSFADAFHALMHPGESSKAVTIIWSFRFPAAVMALLVGAALGLAGTEMQTILGNPLASPFTLGTSAAAGFGAALALTGHALVPLAGFDVCVNAFVCALICSGVVYYTARFKSGSTDVLILAGIAMMFLFNSALAAIEFVASEEELQSIVFWLFGNLSRAGWNEVAVLFSVIIICIPILVMDAWKLSALRLGENNARSLGINVKALRFRMVLVTSLLTAAAICFVGAIAFVGLVAPHIARMLTGEDQRYLAPCAALTGAALLSAAATFGEIAVPTVVLPIGAVTSFIGAPFFIFMILRFRKELF